jgi:hypothetical protein
MKKIASKKNEIFDNSINFLLSNYRIEGDSNYINKDCKNNNIQNPDTTS